MPSFQSPRRHSRGSTSTRAAAKAGVDLIYHADLASEDGLGIVAKAGMPIASVLTSPWIGVAQGIGRAGGGPSTDRLLAQLDQSYRTIRNARDRGIPIRGDRRQYQRQRRTPGPCRRRRPRRCRTLADIVVWDGDPVADIAPMQRPDEIAAIIKGGRVVERAGPAFATLVEEPPRARNPG